MRFPTLGLKRTNADAGEWGSGRNRGGLENLRKGTREKLVHNSVHTSKSGDKLFGGWLTKKRTKKDQAPTKVPTLLLAQFSRGL
jgi:hypothetical protein